VPAAEQAELRAFMDEVWRDVARHEAAAPSSLSWLLRQISTIALVHALVLIATLFLLLLGDALFTSYVLVLRDAVFVSYVAQLGWLQRMAAEFKGAIAFVVAASAVLQMLIVCWRAMSR
jgi:hypothetical protein